MISIERHFCQLYLTDLQSSVVCFYLPVYSSIHLSTHLSVYLSTCFPFSLSFSLYAYLTKFYKEWNVQLNQM
jgi:hypothetical protein